MLKIVGFFYNLADLYFIMGDEFGISPRELQNHARGFDQDCGSGSELDPDSIGSVDPDPEPGGQK
jgi:hypothetical protein